MLLHSVYLEHISPPILIEAIREALSTSRADKLTRGQVQDMWEDRATLIPRSSKVKTQDDTPGGKGKGRGRFNLCSIEEGL
jgi:hypothetical protein